MTRCRWVAFALMLGWSGCAFTLSGGPARSGHVKPLAASVALGASTHAFRDGAGVFGLRLLTKFDDGFSIRSGMLHAGYDWRLVPGWLVFEPGVELGAGKPLTEAFASVGAYAGVAGNLRVRVWGVDDAEPAYNVYAAAFELVLMPRIGGWMPAEGEENQSVVLEWSLELGIRFAIGSDLLTKAQGKIADTESRTQPTDGGAP
jgi:hypothetical protein